VLSSGQGEYDSRREAIDREIVGKPGLPFAHWHQANNGLQLTIILRNRKLRVPKWRQIRERELHFATEYINW
jgi:hypothetical protein